MKDDISVLWHCNKSIFGHVLVFSIAASAVLYSISIPIPVFSIIAALIMWYIAVTTAHYREVMGERNHSQLQNSRIEKEVLDMWYEIEPTWAKDAVPMVSFLISGFAFLMVAVIKYNLFSVP